MQEKENTFYDFFEPDIRLLVVEQQLHIEWEYRQFSAPFWRIYWNEEPGNYILYKGEKIDITPDKVIVISPNTPYRAFVEIPVRHFYIHFVVKPPYNAINGKIFSFPLTSELQSGINSCIELIRQNKYDSFRMVFVCQKIICSILADLPEKELMNPYTDLRVRKVAQYIENHIGEKLNNNDFAKIVGMHSVALNRLFKRQTGQTPLEYLKIHRVENACVMLQFSDKSIEQIAEDLGFYDRFHFSKIFKELRGIGPAQYRNFIT